MAKRQRKAKEIEAPKVVDGPPAVVAMPETIEMISVTDITPYVNNPRIHSPKQLEKIRGSILEYGWTKPIVIDERNVILAGHGAFEAGKQLGVTEIPCVRRVGLSEAQKKAYVIVDNRVGEDSEWDRALLSAEMQHLEEVGFDLASLGFEGHEIKDLLGHEEEAPDQSEDMRQSFSVIIECTNENQQVKLLDELNDRGFKCRALS